KAVCDGDRWSSFNNFIRHGEAGRIVMKGGPGRARDIAPGQYNLLSFDLAPHRHRRQSPAPEYVTIQNNVVWIPSEQGSTESGEIIFPSEFNHRLHIELATNEKLGYYGCCFANMTERNVVLFKPHAIQDFTYSSNYFSDFVGAGHRAGLERHNFAHFDCPLDDTSQGYFILGKYMNNHKNENVLHLSAFIIPKHFTLYIPPNVIHSNDYLRGKWRTMLSDLLVDHVKLKQRRHNPHEMSDFAFDFIV
ncbi:unnamed protein product, partial [Didymodactylos carnosus]